MQNARHTFLILPGLYDSGEGHWQTLWEDLLPDARRVRQHDWQAPRRAEWTAALDQAIRATQGPLTLVAHSLGCALVAWWAAEHGDAPHAAGVRGALLVAPPDVERPDFPSTVCGFAPMPRRPLPFRSIVVASSDDPWCGQAKARGWAEAWGARFEDIGARGHINAESGLGSWLQGRQWLAELQGHSS